MEENFCITDLTVSEHSFKNYHFCRGNNSKRKNRIGLILSGEADFMYLNKKIPVKTGDVIFIPEKLFCYSEWRGSPDIRVFYLSFNIKSGSSRGFNIQIIPGVSESARESLKSAIELTDRDTYSRLKAYSLVYGFLAEYLPSMDGNRKKTDKIIGFATDYITANWNKNFSVADIARECLVSESKLYHLFKEELGQTPVSYLNAVKINYAIQYIEKGDYSVGEICRLTNFHSESYFRRVFKNVTGMNPSDYKRSINRI